MRAAPGKGLKRRSPAGNTKYGALYRSKVMSVPLTINVQGENLDSAVADVDKYLDDAFMAGLEEVTVIHGRGEGILKNGIAQLLKRHKHVVRSAAAPTTRRATASPSCASRNSR